MKGKLMAFNNFEFSKLRAKRHAEKVKQKQEIYEIKHSNDKGKKKIAYGKMLVGFVFLDCLAIQVFIMMLLWRYPDTSQIGSLVGLIGTLLGQGGSYAVYAKKSTAENTTGGIVFETALRNNENSMADDDEAESVG